MINEKPKIPTGEQLKKPTEEEFIKSINEGGIQKVIKDFPGLELKFHANGKFLHGLKVVLQKFSIFTEYDMRAVGISEDAIKEIVESSKEDPLIQELNENLKNTEETIKIENMLERALQREITLLEEKYIRIYL